jgi:hypothetical protein
MTMDGLVVMRAFPMEVQSVSMYCNAFWWIPGIQYSSSSAVEKVAQVAQPGLARLSGDK